MGRQVDAAVASVPMHEALAHGLRPIEFDKLVARVRMKAHIASVF
jgi:hypothetical protein